MAGFAHSKAIERRYAAQLAKVAKEVGKIAARFADDVPGLVRALKEYAARLEPWAADVASRFIGEVDRANARAWAEKSATIAKALKGDVAKSAIGLAAQERHFAQVTLITSLPLEAAARAQKLAEDAARGGKRAGDVREAILETGEVTASRAQLIARTEIAKANAALTQARAQMAGMTHYVWETMQDEDVREEHAILQGRIFSWDNPPEIDGEGAHHPGEIWNCRCFATPLTIEPTAPLELIAPGTTIEQRAAEVATAIARSVAARKAAATRAAKKAETVASRAIAAREAKAVAQVEKGAAALQQAAKKAAAAAEKAAAEAASRQAAMAHLEAAGLRGQSAGGRVMLAGDTYRHKEAIKAAGGKWDGAAKAWTMSEKQAAKLAAKLAPAPLAPPSAEVARIMELTGFTREKAEKRAAEMAAERAAKEAAKKTATTFTQEAYEATRASLQARGVTLAPAMEGTFSGSTIRRAVETKHTQVTRWHLYGDTYAHREAIRAAGGKWLPQAQVWEVTTAQAEALAKAI